MLPGKSDLTVLRNKSFHRLLKLPSFALSVPWGRCSYIYPPLIQQQLFHAHLSASTVKRHSI